MTKNYAILVFLFFFTFSCGDNMVNRYGESINHIRAKLGIPQIDKNFISPVNFKKSEVLWNCQLKNSLSTKSIIIYNDRITESDYYYSGKKKSTGLSEDGLVSEYLTIRYEYSIVKEELISLKIFLSPELVEISNDDAKKTLDSWGLNIPDSIK